MGNAASRELVAAADREAMEAARRGSAEDFFGAVAKEKDRFRICGLAPIYAALAFAGSRRQGTLLGYQQCAADEENESFVSIAAMTL
jgi:hypothetical protein